MTLDVMVAIGSILMIGWTIYGIIVFIETMDQPWHGWKFWMRVFLCGPLAWTVCAGLAFDGKWNKKEGGG